MRSITITTFAASLVFAGVWMLLSFSPFGQIIDLKALDLFSRPHPPHPDIVIVAIDNKSLETVGRWPWPRDKHAELIDKISAYRPTVIGVDVTFPTVSDEKNDLALAQSFKSANVPIVLAGQAVFTRDNPNPKRFIAPLAIFTQAPNVSVGHVQVATDRDGLVRRLPQILTVDGVDIRPFDLLSVRLLNSSTPVGVYWIDRAGPAGTYATISASDILSGNIPADKLANKIVLIGATASDLHDNVLVPGANSVLSGVEWHANVIDNLLLNRSLKVVPSNFTAWLGLIIGLCLLWSRHHISGRLTSQILVGIAVVLPVISYIGWINGWVVSFATNLILAIGLFSAHSIWRWYKAEIDKRQLRQTFQNYFSPAVLAAILTDPTSLRLGGQTREVTILFSDIRSFTTITESLSAERLISLLQEYFTEMGEEILATDGVIDKFIGDAIMAFWGAPIPQDDHADRAVAAARGMIKRLNKLQQKWLAAGYPLVDIGIGINSGAVTVGNMGSSKRFDYTIIGDDVNAASRLEGLNKEYKTHIIISEATKQRLTKPVKTRKLGDITVKGKTVPIRIYSVDSDD